MTPARLQLPNDISAPDPWLPQALETLGAGGLVVLPTETVYGIAARADDPAALERLALAKGTPLPRPWTWHVGNVQALGPGLRTPPVERLIARYWPGPLTLVLPGAPDNLTHITTDDWLGIRCTSGPFSAALCNAAPFPLVMTSANEHGQEAATDEQSFEELVLSDSDLILAGGPTHHQEASTILRLGAGRFELLREGQHTMDELKRTAGMKIAFACTGNTCRSPMAEGLARARLAQRLECAPQDIGLHGFEVSSLGIMAGDGSPAAEHAVETMRARKINIEAHVSRQATPERIAELDAVYCLTRSHLAALQQMLPAGERNLLHLLDPNGRNIGDPIGGNAEVYQACADEIAACIERRLKHWA